jgi:hypothetical protein
MIAMDILQNKIIFFLSGVPCEVSGFSESNDCFSLPGDAELNKVKTGADGKCIATRTGEQGGEVTVKVLPNSPFVDRMAAEMALVDRGVQVPIQMTATNTIVGDVVTGVNGVFISGPRGPSYGKAEVGEMVYKFHFEKVIFAPIGSKRGSFTDTLTGGLI